MRILLVGDIVGSPGRRVFKAVAKRLRESGEIHAVVANAENAAAGNGITEKLANELFDGGADLLTMGDHVWNQKDTISHIDREKRMIRPANLASGSPGRGWATVQTEMGPLTAINLQGRVFMPPTECPFRAVDKILEKSLPPDGIVLVDMHAEATSEKIAMGWHLDGRVSCVYGTHTHVQTSDCRILPQGTAYMTDLGMCGPQDSVLGRDIKPVLKKFITGLPARFEVTKGPATLEGAILEVDRKTGRAKVIRAIRESEPFEKQ